MRHIHPILPGSLFAVALLLGGCGLFGGSRGDGPLIPDAMSPITDVPVPAGFSMVDPSTSKLVPGLRFVDHRYKGGDDYLPVVRFYKEQLPQRGWEAGAQEQPSGKEVILHFSNKARGEDLVITVTKRTLGAQIRVKIDPIGRNAGQQGQDR